MAEIKETSKKNYETRLYVSETGILLTGFWAEMRAYYYPDVKRCSVTNEDLAQALKDGKAREIGKPVRIR